MIHSVSQPTHRLVDPSIDHPTQTHPSLLSPRMHACMHAYVRTGMLAVLADAAVARAHVPALLAVLRESGRLCVGLGVGWKRESGSAKARVAASALVNDGSQSVPAPAVPSSPESSIQQSKRGSRTMVNKTCVTDDLVGKRWVEMDVGQHRWDQFDSTSNGTRPASTSG